MNVVGFDSKKLPETKDSFRELMKSKEDWFVRSSNDFDQLAVSPSSPLAALDTQTISAFKESLRFEKGGLAHADYSMLIDQLGEEGVTTVFTYFGIGPKLFTDYKDQECEKRATCSAKLFKVCTSNCVQ